MANERKIFDKNRIATRQMDELIGICKGIMFDGVVVESEARQLLLWFQANPEVIPQWPAKPLFETLAHVLQDSGLTSERECRLLVLLADFIGSATVLQGGENASTQLPLCSPAPEVVFQSTLFVLTGTFSIGSRGQVIELIKQKGADVCINLRKDTNYLVIGDIGSKAWLHSTHGRKIEKAVELRGLGTGINIISEAHFIEALL